jgi:hypothetical protein
MFPPAPSPGLRRTQSSRTPGEGRGEGDFELQAMFYARDHPNPLPEYRERGPENQPHSLSA